MKPLAIIPVFNEGDILPAVIKHLESQGCEVYLLDNWSTDGFNFPIESELWPDQQPEVYDWTGILKRIEEIALEKGKGRWVIFHDADEIRRSHNGKTLAEAFEEVELQGYNAVQFSVEHYVPVNNSWVTGGNPEEYFRFHKKKHVDKGLSHVKAWIQGNDRVDIHSTGGHAVRFTDIHVFPQKFVLKHYPIRSQEHGERKVLVERFPRYSKKERDKKWHVQYDGFVSQEKPIFIEQPENLIHSKRDICIVTLTRFPEIFENLAKSLDIFDSGYRKIVVTSGGAKIKHDGWEVIEGIEPFKFARNLNLGIKAAGNADVFCINDDTEFVADIVDELSQVADISNAGIVTPQIVGGGIANQLARSYCNLRSRYIISKDYIPFVSVFIRRSIINKIGLLDETFSGYGGEDVEYCLRAQKNGLPLVISKTRLKHGHGNNNHTSSFTRVMDSQELKESCLQTIQELPSKFDDIETKQKAQALVDKLVPQIT